jgi:hypothetical protein
MVKPASSPTNATPYFTSSTSLGRHHQLRLEQLIYALTARTQIVLAKIRQNYFNAAN